MYFSVANVIPLNYCDQQKSGIVKATKANGLVIESISNSSSGNVLMSKVMLNEKIKIEV